MGARESRSAMSPEEAEENARRVAEGIKGDVRMISACRDSENSMDIGDVSQLRRPNNNASSAITRMNPFRNNTESSGAGGACTNALLLTLEDGQEPSWLSLLKGMRRILKRERFRQIPQLSASRQIDVNGFFSVKNPEGSGKMKSLLIGINYTGQGSHELRGCHNDVERMKKYLNTQGYRVDRDSCLILMDDEKHGSPTKQGILNGFRWLVSGSTAGDSLFMFFSGHGSSVPDTSGDEVDGMDETLIPVDWERSGQIVDDVIFEELVTTLPEGVTLTVLIDCCHSGTVLDLPYIMNANDGTISAIEVGKTLSVLGVNVNLNISKVIRAARKIISRLRGRGLDDTRLREIAQGESP